MKFKFVEKLGTMTAEQLKDNADRCAERGHRMDEGLEDSRDRYANDAEYIYSMKLYYIKSGEASKTEAFNE